MFKIITNRPLWLNVLVGIGFAILLFVGFVLSLNWITHHDEARSVPNVVGKSFDEAQKILKTAGFEIEIQDSIYSDTSKRGMVLKQFPESEEVVKVNRAVYLTLNRTVPPSIEMPNLVGYSFRNAQMTLINGGLKLGDTIFRTYFAKDAVLEQLYDGKPIAPGTKILMGSSISFVLGSGVGADQFAVPDLIGMPFATAKQKLEAVGISFAVVLPNADVTDTAAAFIFWQNPTRFNEDKQIQHIRAGQTMDVKLQLTAPPRDSTNQVPLTLPD